MRAMKTGLASCAVTFALLAAPLAGEAQAAEKVGEKRSIRRPALVAAGHPTKPN